MKAQQPNGCEHFIKPSNAADRLLRTPVAVEKAERKGMHKRMGCKAHWEFQHRSNLMVVRI